MMEFVLGQVSHIPSEFNKYQVATKVVAEKNLYSGTGKQQKLIVPGDMQGRVVDAWEENLHKYIIVEFNNGVKQQYGDARHPLISWKGFIRFTG